MRWQTRILGTFLILISFSERISSQNPLDKFKEKTDFYLLENFVSRTINDSIFVSSTYQYEAPDSTNDGDFYFRDRKTKKKLFPYGFEMAYPFVGQTAVVKYKGRWGLIDRSGKFIYYSESDYPVKLTSYEQYAVFDNTIMYDLSSGTLQKHSIYCAEPATPDYFLTTSKTGKYNLRNKKNEKVFKTELDTIIARSALLYEGNSGRNILIVKKKNKYGLFHTNGSEILQTQYENARFIGNYIMLLQNKRWNYYLYQNNQLNLILSTPVECITPAYQAKVIGAFKKGSRYNLLKINGESLTENFDYIGGNATYGVKENALMIFDSDANYYTYTEK